MAARATRSRGRPSGRRGGTNWARLVPTGLTTVAAATKALLITFALDNPGISETVRRTRGMIWLKSDATSVEDQLGALGIILANDLALAAGAASLPGPVTDASDEGWFVWQPTLMSVANSSNPGVNGYQFEFDSKAMRTIDDGFGLAVMYENASATFGLQVAVAMSLLSSRG